MTTGLPTSRLINLSWSLTSAGAQYANINSLLILGDSNVIDVTQRIRSYPSALAVAGDFGTTAPEYLAAVYFFEQSPAPTQLYIGRWARTATQGVLMGANLTTAQQALANFTAVTSGGFKITINGGSAVNVPGINLSTALSLSGVAALITAALTTASVAATCTWNGSQFVFATTSTGTTASVAFLIAPTSGADISGLLGGQAASGGYTVAGIAAESALAAVQALDSVSTYWYALTWACATMPADADYTAIAAYIETTAHLHGITTAENSAITSGNTSDIGSTLKGAGYKRTFGFWSGNTPYAAAGALGDLLTTNLAGSDTMPTLMWKAIAGATPDALTAAQANTLDGKRYNYFTGFANGASVIVNGMCFGNAYIDEVYGADWLANVIQTDLFNLFATQPKVAQTDKGIGLVRATIKGSLKQGVNNGLIGENLTWHGAPFGSLNTGDIISSGFYVYIPPIASQSPASRSARVTPPIQIAINLAGAVDTVSVSMLINR